MELVELLKKFYSITSEIFYEEMADYANHTKLHQLNQQSKELEEQIIIYSKKQSAFEDFSKAIEELDPDLFNILISNLDSTPNAKTLYDIMSDYNNIHKSKIVIPNSALQFIKINY